MHAKGRAFPSKGAALWLGLALCLLLLTGQTIAAPARQALARQTYVIGDFDTIRLEAPLDAAVTSGRGASAIATGDRATLDALQLDLNGRTLVIRLRQGPFAGSARGVARLALTTGSVRRAALQGAGRLTVDRLRGDRGEAAVRGSGSITIGTAALDHLSLGVMGSGRLTLAGRVGEAMATLSGAGTLDADGLVVQRLRLDAEGSAEATISASETAAITGNGPVRIAVGGHPTCTVRSVGSADVTCGGDAY